MGNDFQSRILHPSVKIKIFSDVQSLKQLDCNDQFLILLEDVPHEIKDLNPEQKFKKHGIQTKESYENFHIDDDEGVALGHIVAKPISKKPN